MGNWKLKNLVKEKTQLAAFKYLTEQQKKQSKILHIKYKSLDLQEYLLAGNKNIDVSGEEILTCCFFGREPIVKPVKYDGTVCSGVLS